VPVTKSSRYTPSFGVSGVNSSEMPSLTTRPDKVLSSSGCGFGGASNSSM
jgi:hypothetical protein